MNCKKCGFPLKDGDQFCKNCGAAVNDTPASNPTQTVGVNPTPVAQPAVQTVGVNPTPVAQPAVQPAAVNPATQAFQQTSNIQTPNNGYQQSYNNGYTANANTSNNKLVLYIVIAVVVVVAIFAGVYLMTKKNSSATNTSTVATANTVAVTISGYKFNIPTDYTYEVKDGALYIENADQSWTSMIAVSTDGSFSSGTSQQNALKQYFTGKGYTVETVAEKTLSGSKYITIEIKNQGLVAYTGDSSHIIAVTIVNEDFGYDYDGLNVLAGIINNAKATSSTTNNIKADNILNVDPFGTK